MVNKCENIARFHLPGMFEFYEFYKVFLPVFQKHREYFYEWIEIASVYGVPADCLWSGGRFGYGDDDAEEVRDFYNKYGISARLTFSNSLLREEHLSDAKCNELCKVFEKGDGSNGVIVHSELLTSYLKKEYPRLYLVSSTTKVLTEYQQFYEELSRAEFRYIVPDFRINKQLDSLALLTAKEKDKVEFLCNECCFAGCMNRKACYENVSRRVLGEECEDYQCTAPGGNEGYQFSKAMENPCFISVEDIKDTYLPRGFTNYKIEGRGLGTAILLEFILYYMVKPEYQLKMREAIYLDSMLDLF